MAGKEFKHDIIKQLGEGSFGTVQLIRNVSTGKLYVQKIMKYNKKQSEARVVKEILIVKYLKPTCRDYFLCYKAFGLSKSQAVLITDYIQGSYSLGSYLLNNNPKILECLFIMRDMAQGLAKLHTQKVVHRDIKPGNILYVPKRGMRCKYIDYGTACMDSKKFTNFLLKLPEQEQKAIPGHIVAKIMQEMINCWNSGVGTPAYYAPEVIKDELTNFNDLYPADVWSLGITFYQIAFSTVPIIRDDIAGLLFSIASLREGISCKNHSPDTTKKRISVFCPIIEQILQLDPKKRPTAKQIVRIIDDVISRFMIQRKIPQKIFPSRDDLSLHVKVNPKTKYAIMEKNPIFRTILITSRPQKLKARYKPVPMLKRGKTPRFFRDTYEKNNN